MRTGLTDSWRSRGHAVGRTQTTNKSRMNRKIRPKVLQCIQKEARLPQIPENQRRANILPSGLLKNSKFAGLQKW